MVPHSHLLSCLSCSRLPMVMMLTQREVGGCSTGISFQSPVPGCQGGTGTSAIETSAEPEHPPFSHFQFLSACSLFSITLPSGPACSSPDRLLAEKVRKAGDQRGEEGRNRSPSSTGKQTPQVPGYRGGKGTSELLNGLTVPSALSCPVSPLTLASLAVWLWIWTFSLWADGDAGPERSLPGASVHHVALLLGVLIQPSLRAFTPTPLLLRGAGLLGLSCWPQCPPGTESVQLIQSSFLPGPMTAVPDLSLHPK